MKRIIVLTLALLLCLVNTAVYSESIDLSSLSYNELVVLQSKIVKEITSRPEYKEVTVPLGVYKCFDQNDLTVN